MNAQKHSIYFRPLRFTLVLFIAAALILMPGVSLAAENITPEAVLLQRINQERAQAGLPAYRLNAALCQAASIKCMDMVREGYFAHESPTLGQYIRSASKHGAIRILRRKHCTIQLP